MITRHQRVEIRVGMQRSLTDLQARLQNGGIWVESPVNTFEKKPLQDAVKPVINSLVQSCLDLEPEITLSLITFIDRREIVRIEVASKEEISDLQRHAQALIATQ